MRAKQTEVILGAKQPDTRPVHSFDDASSPDLGRITIVEIGIPVMQVERDSRLAGQDCGRPRHVMSRHIEIDITIGSEARRWIVAGDGPPLAGNGVNSGASECLKRAGETQLVLTRRQGRPSIRVMKPVEALAVRDIFSRNSEPQASGSASQHEFPESVIDCDAAGNIAGSPGS